MKENEFLDLVRDYPVFTTRQISTLLNGMGYAKVYLHRLVKKGSIRRLKNGLYTTRDDPLAYATHLYYPSYVSLWYALQHHGTTTQLPRTIQVMAPRNGSVPGVELIRSKHLWGYHAISYLGTQVFMADLEKAVIDALSTGLVPLDEVESAICECRIDVLEAYTLRMDRSTMKKVGYASEHAGVFLDEVHGRLRNDRNYVRLTGDISKNRWRVTGD